MVQNVQSIIKRKRFVSYSKYVGHVKQAVNEINVDMVQEVTQMYDEAGKMVDASVLINNLRILTGVLFVFHPVGGVHQNIMQYRILSAGVAAFPKTAGFFPVWRYGTMPERY